MKKFLFLFILAIASTCICCSSFAESKSKSEYYSLLQSSDIDTATIYYSKINDSIYYFKFDNISRNNANGYFFVVGSEPFVKKEKFNVEIRKKKHLLSIRGSKYNLRLDFAFRNDVFGGKYAINNKFIGIFRNLDWSERILVKKYEKSDFIKYPSRYEEKLFDSIIIKHDVVYGRAKGYWDSYPNETEQYYEILMNGLLSSINKKNLELKMDIYYPDNDEVKQRALIMFVHGGGFYIGDKKSEAMVQWCKYFAELGYVTASVNYRMGYKPIGPSVERAGYRALQDVHAAMRYLVQNNDVYGIDTDYLFAAGSSAGGVSSLNLAFMRNHNRPRSSFSSLISEDLGNIESSTNSIKKPFEIKAVVNMWGAISDLSILENSNTSILSFHGDQDMVVPIDYDYPFKDIKANISSIILSKLYGSLPIHIKARELGLREELHIFEGNGHSPHVDKNNKLNAIFDFITERIRIFLLEELTPSKYRIISIPPTPIARAMSIYKTNSTNYSKIHWNIKGGLILSQKDNSVKVVWFEGEDNYSLQLSLLFNTGVSYYDEYEFQKSER